MSPSYRCTSCDTLWPIRPEFAVCPDCGVQTGRYGKPPTVDESQVNHGLFTAYLRRNGRLDEAA